MAKFSQLSNQQFWNKQSKLFKTSKFGAHSDPNIVRLENEFIINEIKGKKPNSLLDLGCGNGRRTLIFSEFVRERVLGIDYSNEMIKNANNFIKNKKIKSKVKFDQVDVNRINIDEKFDVIIACRCFINLNSVQKQIKLFKNLKNNLKKGGSLIIAEGSKEGYFNLNFHRRQLGLSPINISKFNLPINESRVLNAIKNDYQIKKIERLGSYYFLTRTVYPYFIKPINPNPKSKFNKMMLEINQKLFENSNELDKFGAHLLVHFIKK